MLDKIESLRTKPKQVKNQYAFWIAFTVTALIALAWAFTLPGRFRNELVLPQEHENEPGSFKMTLTDILSNIKASFTQMHTTVEYVKDGNPKADTDANTLDLDALYASSSSEQDTSLTTPQMQASSTASSSTTTTNRAQ